MKLILITGEGCPQCPAMRQRATAVAAEEGVALTELRRETVHGSVWLDMVGARAVPTVIAVDATGRPTGALTGIHPRARIRALLDVR